MTKNKNQQFKIAVVVVLVICLISSIIAAVRSSTSSPSEPVSAPALAPASNEVKITNDGIQFPKPSTTEGYLTEGIHCKKLQVLEPSAFENGPTNGFSDYESYEAHRLEYDSKRWGDNGYCKLMGFTDENQRAIGYFYHDGNYDDGAFDSNTGRCKFTGEDKPYACVYKEVKDGEFITGFKNNEGKKLEVEFYNDYKAGKLDKWFEKIKMGTKRKFILNSEGKLEFSLNEPEKGISGSFVIKPGNNYPVQFMLLGTAIAMVDNNIPMPENGLDIRFTSLTEKEMRENFENEMSKIVPMGGPDEAAQKRSGEKIYMEGAYIKFYEDCNQEPVNFVKIDRNTLKDGEEIIGTIKSEPGQKIKRIELGNVTILGTSQFKRYKEDAPNRADVSEDWREITCSNGGCEKLAKVSTLMDIYFKNDSVYLPNNCSSSTDYYEDITFNYKVSRK